VQNVRATFVLIVVSCASCRVSCRVVWTRSALSLRPALLACVCSFMKRERPRGTTRRCTCRSSPRCRIRPSTRRSWRPSLATTPSPLRRLGPTRSNSLRAPTFRYRSRSRACTRNSASTGHASNNERGPINGAFYVGGVHDGADEVPNRQRRCKEPNTRAAAVQPARLPEEQIQGQSRIPRLCVSCRVCRVGPETNQ
jgi:hypothetical protein